LGTVDYSDATPGLGYLFRKTSVSVSVKRPCHPASDPLRLGE